MVLLCQQLLGHGVSSFTKGKDGGRDARFSGQAQLLPSTTKPWTGLTIVQAKHTSAYNASYSEPSFFSATSDTCVLAKEVQSLKRLIKEDGARNYLFFSNRKLSANTNEDVVSYIKEQVGLPDENILVCGLSHLEKWMKTFPSVAKAAEFDPVDFPLSIDPADLAEVIEAFARQRDGLVGSVPKTPIERTSYEEKNRVNSMTEAYAEEQKKKFLKDEKEIRQFLSDPRNEHYQQTYQEVAQDFQLKLLSRRKDYQHFDQILERFYDLLIGRDPDLKRRGMKALTRSLLFYMYWNCDIGLSPNDLSK